LTLKILISHERACHFSMMLLRFWYVMKSDHFLLVLWMEI